MFFFKTFTLILVANYAFAQPLSQTTFPIAGHGVASVGGFGVGMGGISGMDLGFGGGLGAGLPTYDVTMMGNNQYGMGRYPFFTGLNNYLGPFVSQSKQTVQTYPFGTLQNSLDGTGLGAFSMTNVGVPPTGTIGGGIGGIGGGIIDTTHGMNGYGMGLGAGLGGNIIGSGLVAEKVPSYTSYPIDNVAGSIMMDGPGFGMGMGVGQMMDGPGFGMGVGMGGIGMTGGLVTSEALPTMTMYNSVNPLVG